MLYNFGPHGELQKKLRQDPTLRRILQHSEREAFIEGLIAFGGRQVSDVEVSRYLSHLKRDSGDNFSPEEVRALKRALLG